MERKKYVFSFCLYIFFFLFFKNLQLHSEKILCFPYRPGPSMFFKTQASLSKEYPSCKFCCFKTNTNVKKEKKSLLLFRTRYLNTGGPRWWSPVTASSWCHIICPHSPSMVSYIHEYIDVHSPVSGRHIERWCARCFDAAASWRQGLVPAALCIFLMGLFRYQSSSYSEKVHSPTHSSTPISPISQRQKKTLHLIWIPSEA